MIRFHTLGTVDLTGRDGRSLEAILARPKRLSLLAYLAIARPRGFHRRDKLAALFWPDVDDERARGSLNQAVYVLRRAIGATVLVSRGGEEIKLLDDGFWCDACAFDAALEAGRPEEAMALYRGELLEGLFISDAPEFERWLDRERERLRARAAEAAWRLAETLELGGDLAAAAERARMAASLSPTDEAGCRRLMTLLERTGDRAGALAAYEQFRNLLRVDFELEPSAETEDLVARIRHATDRDARPSTPVAHSALVPTHHAPTAAVAVPFVGGPRPPAASRPRQWIWRWSVGAAAIAAALTLAGYGIGDSLGAFNRRKDSDGGREPDAPPSLAVMPFVDVGGDGAGDYFNDGLTEEIIGALGQVDGLFVVARTSSFAFRGTRTDVREIGRRLGARYVLEGSVRRDAQQLRITVQLIDVGTGYGIWSDSFERTLGDVLGLQKEVGQAILDELRPRLLGSSEELRFASATSDLEAYEWYLRGRHHFNQRSVSAALKAVEFFEKAIERDSSFAQAHAGLADVLALLPYYRAARPEQIVPRAKAAARRAITLDPTLAEPHSTLGWIAFTYDWDWATAERELETALRLNPSYTNALHFHSLYLARVRGRHEEAIDLAARAQRLDPLSPVIHTGAGAVYYHARQFDHAIVAHRRALALDSSYSVARYMLGESHLAAGRPDDALAALTRVGAGEVPSGDRDAALAGYALAMLGRRAEAERKLADAKRAAISPVTIAAVYTGLGERDSAFAWLERAARERDPAIVEMNHEPLLDPVRADPRFRRLAARIGLP